MSKLIKIAFLISVVGLVAAGLVVFLNKDKIGGITNVLSSQEAADKAIKFINEKMLNGQATSSLMSVTEESGLYKFHFSLEGKEYDFYISICIDNAFYSNIQLNHYIDSGCLCKVCSIKRKEIFEKAKRGEIISEKIMHTNLVNDFVINKIQVLKKKKKIYNLINNNKNKNIKNFDLQLK
ncbi:MAG: hypothetical protein NT116_01905 [Candidatus Parcubacteria bacterium]|nr:hypothetical protein [Candidatus Parcubacteria bacterium]